MNRCFWFMKVFFCFFLGVTGLLHGMAKREVAELREVGPSPKKARAGASGPLTPQRSLGSRKRGEPDQGISPQQVKMSADNISRQIYKTLSLPGQAAAQGAVALLLDWYQRFPMIFGKIKWFTPEDKRQEVQTEFRFKLAGALHHTILSCLAKSSDADMDVQSAIEQEGGVDTCISSLQLGGFLCKSKINKNEQRTYHSIEGVSRDLAMPVYNQGNKIKESFKNYLFSVQDTPEFQKVLQDVLASIPEAMRVPKEQFYHALVYGMINFMGSSFSMIEAYSGEGRADMLLVSDMSKTSDARNCIIEFKYNRSAQEALQQIEAMHYSKYFGPGSVIAVGINIKGSPFQVSCAKRIIQCPGSVVSKAGDTVYGIVPWC